MCCMSDGYILKSAHACTLSHVHRHNMHIKSSVNARAPALVVLPPTLLDHEPLQADCRASERRSASQGGYLHMTHCRLRTDTANVYA